MYMKYHYHYYYLLNPCTYLGVWEDRRSLGMIRHIGPLTCSGPMAVVLISDWLAALLLGLIWDNNRLDVVALGHSGSSMLQENKHQSY